MIVTADQKKGKAPRPRPVAAAGRPPKTASELIAIIEAMVAKSHPLTCKGCRASLHESLSALAPELAKVGG